MTTPDDIDALRTALAAERAARQQAEARASGAEAMVAHLKLLIAKMKRDRFGQSSERAQHLLDQMELQLEELEADAAEDDAAIVPVDTAPVVGFTRRKPVRAPLPAYLPRERVVIAVNGHRSFRRSGHLKFPRLAGRSTAPFRGGRRVERRV